MVYFITKTTSRSAYYLINGGLSYFIMDIVMRVTTRAIIADKDKLLLVRHKAYDGKSGKDFYCTVGGKLEDGESLTEGLKREVLEETGIRAEVGRLLCVQQYHDQHYDDDYLEFFFHVTNTDDFRDVDLDSSSHGNHEIDEVGFYDPKSIYLLPEFLSQIDVDQLLSGPEVKIYNYL